jgi:hypothetical protein
MSLVGYQHLECHSRFVNIKYPFGIFQIDDFDTIKSDVMLALDHLENQIVNNAENLKANPSYNSGDTNDQQTNLLTSCHNLYNLFDTDLPVFQVIKNNCLSFVKEYVETVYETQCPALYYKSWGNKLYQMEYLNKHSHANIDSEDIIFVSMHLTVNSTGGSTSYYLPNSDSVFRIPNADGMVTIFPGTVEHGVEPNHCFNNVRYSIAADFSEKYISMDRIGYTGD